MKKYRNISRILAAVLIMAMLLPGIGMSAFSADNPCTQDGCSGAYSNGICSADAAHHEAATLQDGIYQISNAGQLYWFAALVNSGANEYSGDNGDVYNAVLNADITVPAGLAWTPIGLYTGAREYVRYSGTFDGAGHTVSGLYYNNTAYTGRTVGFIGCLDSNGTVRDLTLANASINGATDIGGIVAHNYGTVSGCAISGTVSGTGTTGGIVSRNMAGGRVEDCENRTAVSGAVTGGIAGENTAIIVDCSNGGAVSGTNSVGGIAGINSGNLARCLNTANVTGANTHVGGVVGNHVAGEIGRCGNTGNVTGGSDYIGGVAGVCSGAAVIESYNTGAVTGAAASDAVGGVAGTIDGTNLIASAITSCYNTGDVTGRSWVGGIAGVSGYQETPQTVTFTNSYTTGTVTGTSHYGAVIGALNKGTVSGTYYLTGAENTVSGATAATAAQFASGEICYVLNGSTSEGELVWFQTIGADASPRFDGEVVYHNEADGSYYNDLSEVAQNTATGTVYSSVYTALTAAEAGQTIILLADCADTYVLAAPGVTLDLNGYELTVGYAVGFETAHIVDNVGTGRLVTAMDHLILDEGNAMIPVYDGEGYVFTKAGFAIRQDTSCTEGFKIDAVACPVNMDVVDLLQGGGADNNVQIVIQLTWDTEDGVGSQQFVFTDAVVGQIYSSNTGSWNGYGRMFSLVVTGFDRIENLNARIAILSGTNAEYISPTSIDIT